MVIRLIINSLAGFPNEVASEPIRVCVCVGEGVSVGCVWGVCFELASLAFMKARYHLCSIFV